MLYLVHDEVGRITQASKVYSHVKETEEQFRDLNIPFVMLEHPHLLSTDRWMIDMDTNGPTWVTDRPVMQVKVSKTIVKAGGVDTTVITGAPPHTEYEVQGAGGILFKGDLPNGEIEIGIPCVVVYSLLLRKWPWQDCVIQIQAVP